MRRHWVSRCSTVLWFLLFVNQVSSLSAQNAGTSLTPAKSALQEAEMQQVAQILGLDDSVRRLQALQIETICGSASSLEQLTLRQHLLESIQAAELDVDSAVGEIANERGELGNLQTSLKATRDKTVARLNAAALITGSGVGAAVSATQFTSLGSRTNNVGDAVGVGAGAASTLLAYLAVRKQHGPDGTVEEIPNMLAPLFDRAAALNAGYPSTVLEYLQRVPPAESAQHESRLERLKAEWVQAGRLDSKSTISGQKKISALTSSGSKDVKISIDDLTDRIAMLGDVAGRISLMKRDLALLLRSYMSAPRCGPH